MIRSVLRETARRLQPLDIAVLGNKSRGIGYRGTYIGAYRGKDIKKNPYKPHLKKCWRVPAKQNAAFAAAMEDVLAACHRPCDERKPVVCMDEQPVQLPGEKREPIPMNEHHSKREDNEYVRKGTCGVFMFVEPLGGRRYAAASERRTKQDWAREAFEIAQRLETRYTPKHGSRLNIAEIELSAMTSQCLNRWIDTLDKLNREVTAWQNDRNRNQKTVKWQFTAEDARIKLHGLYPVI